MRDPRTDDIAREAARLLERGDETGIDRAIRSASERLDARDAPRPGRGRVRMHMQAMAMQILGEAGYQAQIDEVHRIAAEIMSTLEHAIPDSTTLLIGRTARGEIDHDCVIHIRLFTDESITTIAELLVDHGCEEPDFETADTKHGRLDRLRFFDQGEEVVVTRCLPGLRKHAATDLFTGRPIETRTLQEMESTDGA